MRLFLLFVLIHLTSFAQVTDSTLTGIVLDDPVFLKVLTEFKYESRKRGIFIDHFISSDLGGIKILSKSEITSINQRPNHQNAVGITYRVNSYDILGYWHRIPMIGVREDMLLREYKLIKLIIYHELGHFFGVSHLTDAELKKFKLHIMCPILTKDHLEKELDEEALDDYWHKLKTISHRKRWRRASNNN